VKLQLIAGALLALPWVRIWKPKLDINEISQVFPPKRQGKWGARMSRQYKDVDEPAKRMID
jgi:hypothetical protein